MHRTVIQLEDYEMVRTPYGGRLTWKLLGGNSLVCHLKDKTKIRHKKRWSQVHCETFGHIAAKNIL